MKTELKLLITFSVFFFSLFISAMADTHHLTPTSNNAEWTGTLKITGAGATFLSEDVDYYHSDWYTSRPHHLILYHITKEVELEFNIAYAGPVGANASYHIGNDEGSTYTTHVTIDRTDDVVENFRTIYASINWEEIVSHPDGSSHTNYFSNSCEFQVELQFWKPLDVEIQNPYGAGTRRLLKTMEVNPVISPPDTNGVQQIIRTTHVPWANVGVRVEPLDDSVIKPAEGWVRTDSGGTAEIHILASLDSDDVSDGWIAGKVLIKAVSGGVELIKEHWVNCAYAGVVYADHAYVKGELGQTLSPIVAGMSLERGMHIQVGTTLLSGGLQIEFCNGQKAHLQANFTEGCTAVIGEGSISEGPYLMTLYLRNELQEWKDTPRRCMRMQLFKKLGGILDTALRVPGAVGIVSETPGGYLSKLGLDFTEKAYSSRQPVPLSNRSLSFSTLSDPTAKSIETRAMNHSISANLDFYTDGSMYLENSGGNVQMGAESGAAINVAAGAAVMMELPRTDGADPTFSARATSSTAWGASEPSSWTFSPAHGQTVLTRTPQFSILTANFLGLVPESCQLRIDDQRVTDGFQITNAGISGQVLDTALLTPGTHTLTLGCLTQKGPWEEQSVSFQISANPSPSEFVETTAFSDGIWISWQRAPDAISYRVWRASTEAGTKKLLTSAPLGQPGFLDLSPGPTNYYWIESLDVAGLTQLTTQSEFCSWTNTLDDAPPVVIPAEVTLTETSEGVVIEFDDFAHNTTRWQLERGIAATGPFTVLEPLEQTLASGYLDTTVLAGRNYFYRLSSLQLDGTLSEATTLFIAVTATPTEPVGTTAAALTNGVKLEWNRYTDIRADGLRIYRHNGLDFALIATLPLSAVSYIDAASLTEPTLYQIRAYGEGGESDSISIGAALYSITSEQSVCNLTASEQRIFEGAGHTDITVTRSGNVKESASILYNVWHGHHAQAEEDVDFEKTAGILTFAPNQTSAVVQINVLPDSIYEYPETFTFSLGAGFGSTVGGTQWYTDISIDESDLFLMADYQTEIFVTETNAEARVWIDRIWPSQREVSVEVAVANPTGSAVSGLDFIPFAPKRVVFPSGISHASVTIELLDDDIKDGTKVLNVQIQNPEGGAAIGSDYSALAIHIRDDDIVPGQLAFKAPNHLVIAEPGLNQVQIPITREGGTEGAIEATTFAMSPNLPWGAVSLSDIFVPDGGTSTVVTATLDRTGFDGRMAASCMAWITNREYPYDEDQILLVFGPEGSPASPFASWINGYNVGSLNGAMDDPDLDGWVNVTEYLFGSDPHQFISYPQLNANISDFGFSIEQAIYPDPYVAVVAEFCNNLQGDWIAESGHWNWGATVTNRYDVNFSPFLGDSDHQFGRLKIIWLGE